MLTELECDSALTWCSFTVNNHTVISCLKRLVRALIGQDLLRIISSLLIRVIAQCTLFVNFVIS